MANLNDEKIVVWYDKVSRAITPVLAIMIVIASFALFYAILFKDVKNESRDVILFVAGSVSTILTQVTAYFFGSSKGSADKDKIIKDNIGKRKTDQIVNPENNEK
jgi:hypothetical protein